PGPAGVVMFTATVHDVAPAHSAPPAIEKRLLPLTAVTTPPQVVTAFGVAAIVWPAGKLSVNDSPVNAGAPLAWVSVTVSRDVPSAATVAGANAFATTSAADVVSVAVVGNCVRPCVVWSTHGAIVFTRPPVTALAATCTGMVIVQDPAAGMVVPMGSENEVAPGTAVKAPPQVVAPAGAAAIV